MSASFVILLSVINCAVVLLTQYVCHKIDMFIQKRKSNKGGK